MPSHAVDHRILENDIQLVEIELDPGEVVVAEAGAMNYMEDGIEFEARLGDGSAADSGLLGKLIGAGKRALGGESLFLTHFHADASPLPALRSVAVAAASRPTQDVPWVTS